MVVGSVLLVEIGWVLPLFNFSSRNSSREEMVDELIALKEREGGSGWFFREVFSSWFSKDLCSLRAYLKERNYIIRLCRGKDYLDRVRSIRLSQLMVAE